MNSNVTKLPIAHLSDEVHIAIEKQIWDRVVATLRKSAPNEGCVFVLTRPSRGVVRTTAILKEPIWPRDGEVRCTPESLELSADYISRALDAAIDAGPAVGLTLLHTHPAGPYGDGPGCFSRRDDWYDVRLFPTLLMGRPDSLCGAVVVGSGVNQVDARVWWLSNGRPVTQPAHAVRVVGPELHMIETPHSAWEDHLDPEIMDRSTLVWGSAGRRVLQNLRVGVIGAGGTGNVVLASLAAMGVGSIRAWDGDIIRKHNRPRFLMVAPDDIGKPKVLVMENRLRQFATAQPFHFHRYAEPGTTSRALALLKDCDVVFSCVDLFAPRVPLNDLAYQHLIPVVDMGSRIYPKDGKVEALLSQPHVFSPGVPCAWCTQLLTSQVLLREAQGEQRGAEHRAAYGLSLQETGGTEPSALPLNLVSTGLAMMQFMQVVLHVSERVPNDLKFFLPQWELDESDLPTKSGCWCVEGAAKGDTEPIRPTSETDSVGPTNPATTSDRSRQPWFLLRLWARLFDRASRGCAPQA